MKRCVTAMIVMWVAGCASALPATGASESIDELSDRILSRPQSCARRGYLRQLAAEAVSQRRYNEALETFARLFGKALEEEDSTPTERETEVLLPAADAFLLTGSLREYAATVTLRREVVGWVLASDAALRLFLDMVSPRDHWPGVWRVLTVLYDHDPAGRDEYRRLMFALAVVWDQARPPLHRQMGGKQLAFEPEISARYDYFKELFQSNDAEIRYRRLSAPALMYIVDTPVPLSELIWVRENVRPSRWQRKFFDIDYDEDRLERKVYQWPHGPYTLAAIEDKGGICVDQAYYATLCARAYGVPALMFAGEGRRGPHAWYGYMKGTEKWEMDIGRYIYDKYATGFAIDPQTNEPLTDHDVTFMCDRALDDDTFTRAAAYGRLALVFHNLGYRSAAEEAARQSLDVSPLYELPWRILEMMDERDGDWRALASLLDRKADVFRKYPDYTARIRTRQAEALQKCGEDEAAERLLTRRVRRVDHDRDDLQRALVSEQIRMAYEAGDMEEARESYEDLLDDQKDEGQKVLRLIDGYLVLTKKIDQTEDAARFMKRYVDSLERRYGHTDQNRILLLRFLLQAYENDGDDTRAERTRRKIERLAD